MICTTLVIHVCVIGRVDARTCMYTHTMLSPHLVPSLMSPGLTSSSPTSEVTELQQDEKHSFVYKHSQLMYKAE